MAPAPGMHLCGGWLQRGQWQPALFAEDPLRHDLLRLSPSWPCAPFRLRVHRNQGFEFVGSLLAPFLAFSGRTAELRVCDFDDSLALPAEGPADVELLWLDHARFLPHLSPVSLAWWLEQRLRDLRARSEATLLLTDCPSPDPVAAELNRLLADLAGRLPGLRLVPLSTLGAALGDGVFDRRVSAATGLLLSERACVRAAQLLGLVCLPAALGPRLRAIVLDLDRTLYEGVLADAGPLALHLSPAHRLLQEKLLALQRGGLLLALASRSEPDEVRGLFAARSDFPLQLEQFAVRSVPLREKVAGLLELAALLQLTPAEMLLLDDNPGEIALAAAGLPGLRILHAADPLLVCRALDLYPNLAGYPGTGAELTRVAELVTSALRAEAESRADAVDERAQLAEARLLEVALGFSSVAAGPLGGSGLACVEPT